MLKPIDIGTLIRTPVSELQKHVVELFHNTDEYKTEVIINGGEILYSPCGMFIYLYNENLDTLNWMLELGILN
jgi:hypothetical protein